MVSRACIRGCVVRLGCLFGKSGDAVVDPVFCFFIIFLTLVFFPPAFLLTVLFPMIQQFFLGSFKGLSEIPAVQPLNIHTVPRRPNDRPKTPPKALRSTPHSPTQRRRSWPNPLFQLFASCTSTVSLLVLPAQRLGFGVRKCFLLVCSKEEGVYRPCCHVHAQHLLLKI